MANRNTLHINKLEAFKKYLDSQGIAYRPGKGIWQILQVMTPKHDWQCIYERMDMPERVRKGFTINKKITTKV